LLIRVQDYLLIVHPAVYLPDVDSFLMINAIYKEVHDMKRREKALDMGCGSGILSLTLAKFFKKVIAVDINPFAVRCTVLNAYLNGCRRRIVAFISDLFSKVEGDNYDMIVFNTPYLINSKPYDFAYSGSLKLIREFILNAKEMISSQGKILFTWLFRNMKYLSRVMCEFGLDWSIVLSRKIYDEELVVIKVERS